ncbi:thiazole biosynthesis protein ThiG [Secundilactobacillus odoratitofui DSM 19909 = JCM 15043]|uniref:Thiazole synthase n=1 Tax=Secundilactobacillus odoratitofui DSM 19909 = JCM 15043 TaxID=1423776 RepID=A0A0R1LRQ6_9LACO|nr:thiazole synthase [Secundilactobacillus odoratitofui]KRK98152.1 thiazole biosynthesis protein ThiG [Secundilactobacillus odoratitofui DSM 19909 = JCM 15043]
MTTTPTDLLTIADHTFTSRFILGSGKYSYDLIDSAIHQAKAQIITMALRRTSDTEENILDFIPEGITILPNTSGATNAQEAIRTARLARELSGSDFIKLEVVPDKKYLMPDNDETVKATEVLANEGFIVMPYVLPDLNIAKRLVNAGAATVMPLAAPIGTNKGLAAKDLIQILIDEISVPVIIDAGIGRPSQAAEAMEMGADAIMANTSMATAENIPLMAEAFRLGVEAGRKAFLAGPGRVIEHGAVASSPLTGLSQSSHK